jgi:hypothetical protein
MARRGAGGRSSPRPPLPVGEKVQLSTPLLIHHSGRRVLAVARSCRVISLEPAATVSHNVFREGSV